MRERGGRETALQRIVSVLATLAIISSPGLVAGAYAVAPDATTSAITSATTVLSSAAKTVSGTTTSTSTSVTAASTTGNGAPSGSHFNLNIIGVPKDKTADMNNNDGHRIFVQLYGGSSTGDIIGKNFADISKVNTILLAPAPVGGSFQVLDANATDKNGAVFQLPADVST